jgi:hypothetical protein
MAMWRRNGVLPLVLSGLILAGCSSDRRTEPRYLYPPAASCPPVQQQADAGEIRPLPVNFRPVTAVRCVFDVVAGLRSAGPNGVRHEYRMYRSDGPMDALVAALRIPPPTQADDDDLICTLQLESPVFLALTDGSGKTVVPAIPATPCGFRLPEVDAAIRAMTWLTVESR